MKVLLIISIFLMVHCENETDVNEEDFRKHYGLNFNRCPSYVKSFKCMSACKSIGYQVFFMDAKCKCTCREIKTTTILPFFMWRTNGTTKVVPKTYSPLLYHIVGTLSPATEDYEDDTTLASTDSECNCNNVTSGGSDNSTDSTGAEGDNAATLAGDDKVGETAASPGSTETSTP